MNVIIVTENVSQGNRNSNSQSAIWRKQNLWVKSEMTASLSHVKAIQVWSFFYYFHSFRLTNSISAWDCIVRTRTRLFIVRIKSEVVHKPAPWAVQLHAPAHNPSRILLYCWRLTHLHISYIWALKDLTFSLRKSKGGLTSESARRGGGFTWCEASQNMVYLTHRMRRLRKQNPNKRL